MMDGDFDEERRRIGVTERKVKGEGEGEREEEVKEKEEEEEEEAEDKKKKDRPRWPPRKEGVIPDIEWSMKSRIRTAATKLMNDFSLTGEDYERQIMNSIAKGMSREGLKLFRKKKTLALRSLGRGSRFFRDEDKFYESEEEDEEESETRKATSDSGRDIFLDTEEEVTDSAGSVGVWLEEKNVWHGSRHMSDEIGGEGTDNSAMMRTDIETEHEEITQTIYSDTIVKSSEENDFSQKGELEIEEHFADEEEKFSTKEEEISKGKLLEESNRESSAYPEDTEGRSTFDVTSPMNGEDIYFSDNGNEMGNEDYSKTFRPEESTSRTSSQTDGTWQKDYSSSSSDKKKPQKRNISWITLVCSGESCREKLGYISGWTEYGEDGLSGAGREASELAGKGLLDRGTKFDTVITSNMALDREATNLLLYAVGQDSIPRYTTWELNPRHCGDLEGQTVSGTASQWGWLSAEVWAHLGPPSMTESHPDWYRQAKGDRQTGESILHLQTRTRRVWTFAQTLLKKGKRSILIVGRKDVICSLLLHSLGLQPTDLSEWSPSPAVPVHLVFELRGKDIGLAAVDFATEDTRAQTVGLYKAMLERYVDYGILDKYAMAEIKRRHEQDLKIPTMQDIYKYKRKEAGRLFEQRAPEEGARDRLLERLAVLWGRRTGSADRLYRRIQGKAV